MTILAPSGSEPESAVFGSNPMKSLLLVTGKGGVGRSTVVGAIARNAASTGQRVLAIDAIGDGGLDMILDGLPDQDNLVTLRLTPDLALKEYLRTFLRIPIAPNRFGPIAKIFDYVATAAPGVREVLVLGKIATEVRDGDWDLVVVDAPATGHAVELLTAADTLSELIRVGPIVSQTRWIGDLIGDPEVTSVLAVTLAEELPTTECLELLARLETETRVDIGGVIVNRTPTILGKRGLAQALRLGDERSLVAKERSEVAAQQLERLGGCDAPVLVVSPASIAEHPVLHLQEHLDGRL